MKIIYLGNAGNDISKSKAYREHYNNLTIGKIYNIVSNDKNYMEFYIIINDKNEIHSYQKEYFITLDKYRERKINEILA